LVSSKVGVLIIGIGIIAVILLAPREILSPERVKRFAETFKRPEQQVTNGLPTNGVTNGLPTNGVTTMVSPKPVSTKLQAPITTKITFVPPTIDQKPAIPISQTVTTTTLEEQAQFDINIAKLKEEFAKAGVSSQFETTDPITGKQTIQVFLTEKL